MKAGITGLPYSGKTTLFCALTGQDFESIAHRKEIHIGTVKVPDPRVEKLSEVFSPKKTTHTTIEYFDVALQTSGTSKEMEPKVLQTLKNAESLIVIIDSFSDGADPEADLNSLLDEFVFNDLVVVSNRIERLDREMRSGSTDAQNSEKKILEMCREKLEDGLPLRDLELSEGEEKIIRGFQFLTRKTLLIVANISEQLLSEGKAKAIEDKIRAAGNAPCAAICTELEMEIAALDTLEERIEFLDSMGIAEPALDRLISLSYESMGLMSFLTVGSDEVRAWTVRTGSNAVDCAGTIHSDLARGFIRAEAIAYDDFITAGSLKEGREQGLLRVEGKDYIVQDGDILNIRFSV
ncbi:DUF933 domain-containing protein [Candidatus Latescibacterota bacterium]